MAVCFSRDSNHSREPLSHGWPVGAVAQAVSTGKVVELTNDTLLLLASGLSGAEVQPGTADYDTFVAALTQVAEQLSRELAGDGEGGGPSTPSSTATWRSWAA